MNRIGEKGGLIAFDEMAEPGEGECGGNEQEADDPVEPDHDDGREANGNGDHVKGAVDWVVMRAIVVRVETHATPHNLCGGL